MSLRETHFIPDKYLKKEEDLKMSVVDTLSGFYSLTFTADTAEESNDLALQKMQLTTFKQILPAFKNLVISWIKSKTDIRRIYLQDSKVSYAHQLMISNPWCPELFDHQVIAEIKKDLHGKTLLQAGGWTDKNDRQVRAEQKKIDFSRSTFLNFERPSTSTSKQQYLPRSSSYRPSGSNRSRSSTSRNQSFRSRRHSNNKRGFKSSIVTKGLS